MTIPHRVVIMRQEEDNYIVSVQQGQYFPDNDPKRHIIHGAKELKNLLSDLYDWPKPGKKSKKEEK